MYVHRSLESKDLATICGFPQNEEELFYVSPMFVYPLTPEQILQLAKDRYEPTVILEEETEEAAAYANIYDYKPEEGTGWLGNVIVSPNHRGRGAAQYLLSVMMEKAKHKLGMSKIQLACHNTNSRGLAFYSKIGFKPFDIKISSMADKKFITIHMSKEL